MIYYNNTHARNAVEIKELDPLGRCPLKVTVFMTWTSVYDIIYLKLKGYRHSKKIRYKENTPKKYKENAKRGKTQKN